MIPRMLPRALAFSCAALLLSAPALATWSVVVISKVTGEVCCASATCIGGQFPLKRWLPVIVVGKGAAAAQSAVDINATNRFRIWEGFHNGDTPERILDTLATFDGGHQSRQYGIVSFAGAPVTFTGTGAGEGKHGVVGETDELIYAIQGNVITGDVVVTEAELALLNTPGDLGQKVMAAMEAARAMGGDGRCSCSPQDPTGCGAPPPNFSKSAHTAFIVVARLGDKDGVCDKPQGCASGNYYISLKFQGKVADPDPIIKLQEKYDAWRLERIDEADHVHSEIDVDRTALVADGLTTATVRLRLRDIDGNPLTAGGHSVNVKWIGAGEPTALPGEATDHGAGVYSFPLTATTVDGRGLWHVVVNRPGDKKVQLYRPLALVTEPLEELHAGRPVVSLTGPTNVPFSLNLGTAEAGRGYVLLGSASGTVPGVPFGNVVIPLNRDRFFEWTWGGANASFEGSTGTLDPRGWAEASLDLAPAGWAPFVGETLSFSALLAGPPYAVTNVAGVLVTP